MPQGFGGGMPQGMASMPQGMPMGGMQQAVADPPPDLACSASPRTPAWAAAKQHFRGLFPAAAAVPQLASREAMTASMEGALKDLKAMEALGPQAVDECGLGKLCLQLLSFASIDDPAAIVQLFSVALAGAGWPFFGLLSQLNLR